jgi:tRNA pseudouridine55 synthase
MLLIDKPSGMTSHDVVSQVRRLSDQRRVGHVGTLDPLATGLLPLLLGEATKLSTFATVDDKAYETTARLGVRTDTLDAEGAILSEEPVDSGLDAATVESALEPLRGVISQQVPRYSAVKVGGRRLHELAREGKEVETPVREVTIHRLELLDLAVPDLRLAVVCSKGTYIRQLVSDLGDALGPGAHVSALRRTRVGDLDVAEAVTLEALGKPGVLASLLVSPRQWAERALGCLECTEDQMRRTRQGQILSWQELDHPGPRLEPDTRFALVRGDELVAVAQSHPEVDNGYRLLRVFVGPTPPTPPAPESDQQQ